MMTLTLPIGNAYSENCLDGGGWNGNCQDPHSTRQVLRKMFRSVAYEASKGFGNVAGAIKSRHGYLQRDQKTYTKLDQALRPGDVLFEKTGAALTDKFIPGRLGHVALYLGRGWELANLGYKINRPETMTDEAYQAELGNPWVVEALRPGVTTNSLEHFMDIDEIFVFRPNYPSEAAMRDSLKHALLYRGFPYDFLFDLGDDTNIYCTELVTRALDVYPWELKKLLGISTIDPDTLMIQAMTRMDFEPVAAFFNQKLYLEKGPELRSRIEQLFKIRSDGSSWPDLGQESRPHSPVR